MTQGIGTMLSSDVVTRLKWCKRHVEEDLFRRAFADAIAEIERLRSEPMRPMNEAPEATPQGTKVLIWTDAYGWEVASLVSGASHWMAGRYPRIPQGWHPLPEN